MRKPGDAVTDLLQEMQGCTTARACIDLALTDAYDEAEQAVAWLTCIETMFGRFKRVRLLGAEVTLVRFDLRNNEVVAVCQQGNRQARVTLDSLELPNPSPVEQLWLRAWKRFSATSG